MTLTVKVRPAVNELAASSCTLIGHALQQSPALNKGWHNVYPWPVLPHPGEGSVTLDSAYGACGWGHGIGFSTGPGEAGGVVLHGLSTCTVDCEASAPLCAACTPGVEETRSAGAQPCKQVSPPTPSPNHTFTLPHLHTSTLSHNHTSTCTYQRQVTLHTAQQAALEHLPHPHTLPQAHVHVYLHTYRHTLPQADLHYLTHNYILYTRTVQPTFTRLEEACLLRPLPQSQFLTPPHPHTLIQSHPHMPSYTLTFCWLWTIE